MSEKLKNLERCHEILDYVFHGGISKENQTQIAGAMYFLEKYVEEEEARIAQAEAIIKANAEKPIMRDRLVAFEDDDDYLPHGRTYVLFSLPEFVSDSELMDEIDDYFIDEDEPDLDTVCSIVADNLGGTWRYMRQAGTIYQEEE